MLSRSLWFGRNSWRGPKASYGKDCQGTDVPEMWMWFSGSPQEEMDPQKSLPNFPHGPKEKNG